MYYNATDRMSMRLLAMRLKAAPAAARPALVARIVTEGLMVPPWWARLVVRIGSWRNKVDAYTTWARVCGQLPRVADDLIEQTAAWIVSGRDASGVGVGGFNQREVDKLALMLDLIA